MRLNDNILCIIIVILTLLIIYGGQKENKMNSGAEESSIPKFNEEDMSPVAISVSEEADDGTMAVSLGGGASREDSAETMAVSLSNGDDSSAKAVANNFSDKSKVPDYLVPYIKKNED